MMPPQDDEVGPPSRHRRTPEPGPGTGAAVLDPPWCCAGLVSLITGSLMLGRWMSSIVEYLQSMTGIFCRLSTPAPPVAVGSR